MSINIFWGQKIKSTQSFDDKGKRLVVTSIKTLPLTVVQVKNLKNDGYEAYKVKINRMKINKDIFREIKTALVPEIKVGSKITVGAVFKPGDHVQVSGLIKGRGFAGVVKRWGFAGGPKTHGQSDRERSPGSIGMRTTPGRVWKGKKMAGHMGANLKTIKGLTIFKVDEENNQVFVTGVVPGNSKGLVKISKN